MLVAALVLNVSAKTVKYVEVAGVEYYCAVTCNTTSGYGATQTMDDSVTVGTYVMLYKDGAMVMDTGVYDRTYGANVTAYFDSEIDSTSVEHETNGSHFYTSRENAP